MSRCGSTLLSQLLAASPRVVAVSEAAPIDAVLRRTWQDGSMSDDRRLADLRAIVSALGQRRSGAETQYTRHFSTARFDIIEVNGTRIGRLCVLRSAEEIRIIDVALLPAWRSKGIGTLLVRPILDEGRASGRPVTLSVERWNPARRLYARLGFTDESSDDVYVSMRYVAGPTVD
jgi:GNAT superfamily N-acetyltransferase